MLLDESESDFNTGVVEHGCGSVAYYAAGGEEHLVGWSGMDWAEIDSVREVTSDIAGLTVQDHWIADITGDGESELVLQYFSDGVMRNFGGALSASAPKCQWEWLRVVDSCGDQFFYDSMAVESGGMVSGSGFSSRCSVRESVNLVWEPSQSRPSLPAPLGGMCPDYEETLDLPLLVCEHGWPISMAQEALAASGLDVSPDGYFGDGTRSR